ncbi:MAG: dienelactone hydrolase family protein [Myxococcota bacterium]
MRKEEVVVQTAGVSLEGHLNLPDPPRGLVVFAHGSGSSRHSPRNNYVANELAEGGLATLLFDLLTAEEDEIDRVTRELRFDIPRLAERLEGAVHWCGAHESLGGLPVGLFGSSTGAAAALIAAADRPDVVKTVVSRGGRPDLAGEALPRVKASTLLIVGGRDEAVIGMNQEAASRMERSRHELEIVPGATHLFEEPGKLEQVARLARDWFVAELAGPGGRTSG